jgi:hypothetical protein
MLRREMIAVSSVIPAEYKSTLCERIGKILNMKDLKLTFY